MPPLKPDVSDIQALPPLTLIGELRSLTEKAAPAFKLSLWTYADASPTSCRRAR